MWIGPLSFLATAEKFELGKCIYKKGKLNFKIQKTNSIILFAHALKGEKMLVTLALFIMIFLVGFHAFQKAERYITFYTIIRLFACMCY